MNMKGHILAALQEQFDRWEGLLASLTEEQITTPHFEFDWSIKDVMSHLWGWQQISIARMQGGVLEREPVFPEWITELGEDWEEEADQTNAFFFEMNHKRPWSEVYENWRQGFLHLLDLGSQISERDLLDGDLYAWLKGYTLAAVLIASYDHHEEHFYKLQEWLRGKNIS